MAQARPHRRAPSNPRHEPVPTSCNSARGGGYAGAAARKDSSLAEPQSPKRLTSLQSMLQPAPIMQPKPHIVHQSGGGSSDNIKVVVRIRPLSESEADRSDKSIVEVAGDSRSLLVVVPGPRGAKLSRSFSFNACLGPSTRQEDVFARIGVHQLLEAALLGYSCTIFAYGQTGSGKTYTMSGVEDVLINREQYQPGDETEGLITRSLLYLFNAVHKASGGVKHVLKASYSEIYNEQAYDLLEPPGSAPLQVRWDARRGFFIQELTIVELRHVQDAFNTVRQGTHARRVGSHELNMDSSRSHSLFTVHVESVSDKASDDDGPPVTRFGKITFVDLAGSERLKQSKSSGDTMKETGSINKSLFALGKVISALGEGKGSDPGNLYIPYRDSKLTKLLMDSIGGNALSLMIATCSPSSKHVEETLSTLYYATHTNNIKNKPVIQMDPQEQLMTALRKEVHALRGENSALREQLAAHGLSPGQMEPPSLIAPVVSLRQPRASAASSLREIPQTPPLAGDKPSDGNGPKPKKKQVNLNPVEVSSKNNRSIIPQLQTVPSQLNTLPKEELVNHLQQAQALLLEYADRCQAMSDQHNQLRKKHEALETEHRNVLAANEELESKLDHLEAIFVNSNDGTADAFNVSGQGGSQSALNKTFPKFPLSDTVKRQLKLGK